MLTSIRGVLLILFLYLGLAWAGAAAWFVYREGDAAGLLSSGFIPSGLLLTVVGFALLLVVIIGSWVIQSVRLWRERRRSRPKPAAVDEPRGWDSDPASLRGLLGEAAARLNASERFPGKAADPLRLLSGMPLYLVVGGEGSGKTSIVANTRVEALELLAGNAGSAEAGPTPTGVANIWLAGRALVVEIGGRHFSGDMRGWEQILKGLATSASVPLWRRLWAGTSSGPDLKGVVCCSDLGFFVSMPDPEQIERQGQVTNERLRAIVRVFGKQCPVYTLFTKADQIKYFPEFFERLSEGDADEIFGCTLPLGAEREAGSSFAEAETRRISHAFRTLYVSLTDRRVSALFDERVSARKPAIFEFPREFNRIRQNIVSWLVQTFRPNPLEPTPVNRGFYFAGTSEVVSAGAGSGGASTLTGKFGPSLDLGATQIFRGDLTQMTSAGQPGRPGGGVPRTRWVFLSDFFRHVLLVDPAQGAFLPTRGHGFGIQSRAALISVLVVSGLAFTLWTSSWWNNWSLLADVREQARELGSVPASPSFPPSLAELEALERLRVPLATLSEYGREGAPWFWFDNLRWGLYSGNDVVSPARRMYFSRLGPALLDEAASRLEARLSRPEELGPPAIREGLEAAMMTSLSCDVVWNTLDSGLWAGLDAAFASDPRARDLARDQLRFYAHELESAEDPASEGIPLLEISPGVRAGALSLLNDASGATESLYQSLLGAVAHDVVGANLVDVAALTSRVLSGPGPVSIVYTPQGARLLSDLLTSADPSLESARSSCLAPDGLAASGGELTQADRTRLWNRYADEYLTVWADYLGGFRIRTSASPADAAEKLRELSGNESAILQVLQEVRRQTLFDWGRYEVSTDDSDPLEGALSAFTLLEGITSGTDVLAAEGNREYLDSLYQLSQQMERLARSNDAAAHQRAQDALSMARASAQDLRQGFPANTRSDIDGIVGNLLEQPLAGLDLLIPPPPGPPDVLTELRTELNSQVRRLCTDLQPVLRGYPFNSSGADTSLETFRSFFQPQNGRIWATAARLNRLVEFQAGRWVASPEAGPPSPTPELLAFLNKAQDISDSFFTGTDFGFHYAILPEFRDQEQVVFLIDGQRGDLGDLIVRQEYYWPNDGAQSAAGSLETTTTVVFAPMSTGPWAVFRMLGNADFESRPGGEAVLHWTDGGRIQPPVEAELVRSFDDPDQFNADVFNPQFYQGFSCPQTAAR